MRKIDTRDFQRATRTTSREINRRPTMLYVRTQDRLVFAADIHFSRTFVMLSDFGGTQIALESFETIFDPKALVAELSSRIQRLIDAHGARGRCEGLGVVVPGMVDRETGRVLMAPQLDWRGVDIRDDLAEGVGMPVFIENAPMACALAHMWLGQRGNSNDNFVYVTVSYGVGAGIVLNGQLIRGSSNSAGEFGHIILDPAGPQCLCGAHGCWEAYTSNQATLSRYMGRELVPLWGSSVHPPQTLAIDGLIHCARTGDARARTAIEATAHYLGVGISNIVNSLNPSQVFVGGEITSAWDMIEPHVRSVMVERALTPAARVTPVVPEQMGGFPRLRGATALVAAPHFAAPRVA